MTRLMKWLLGLLALSLAFNLFLTGFLTARSFQPKHHERQEVRRGIPDYSLRQFARALPREARRDLQGKLRAERQDFHDRQEKIRGLWREVYGLMLQDKPDRTAIEQKFAAIKAAETETHNRILTLTVDAMDGISADVKQRLRERSERRRRQH